MGLKMSTDFRGITYPNTYYKITAVETTEARTVEGVKQYRADLGVTMYADNTKEVMLDKAVMPMAREDFIEADNTLTKHYDWMKLLPMFDGAVDD